MSIYLKFLQVRVFLILGVSVKNIKYYISLFKIDGLFIKL